MAHQRIKVFRQCCDRHQFKQYMTEYSLPVLQQMLTALIITSSAAPAWLARMMMRHPKTLLKRAAVLAVAKVVKWAHLGMVAMVKDQRLTEKQQLKLRKAAYKITKSDR